MYVLNVCSKMNISSKKYFAVSFIAPIDLPAVKVSYSLSFSDIHLFFFD